MKNIKGIAIGTDGAMKRIAITYDEIANDGSILNANVKANKLVMDSTALKHISAIEEFAKTIISEE